MNVIDDPNHKFYGPARRLFVVLSAVFGDAPALQSDYYREWGTNIYGDFVDDLMLGTEEGPAMRTTLKRVLFAHDCR